LFEVNYLGKI